MEWHEIENDADLARLNELYGYFEDSFIVRMEYLSGDYVDSDLCGHMEQTNDLRVTFQRLDREPFSIELWFSHTKRISLFFANPQDKRLSDILFAKVCRNDSAFFWTLWEEFDPYNPEHLEGTALIEACGLKWRIAES